MFLKKNVVMDNALSFDESSLMVLVNSANFD